MSDFTFSITPYEGFEDEVLYLRNRNRDNPQTREYMDWRYLGQKSTHPPLICWVHDGRGESVGMIGVIFRPYFVNNQIHYFAVWGDFSINPELRGEQLGKKLIEFTQSEINKIRRCCIFTYGHKINQAVEKCLSNVGLIVPDSLISYSLFLDPSRKIRIFLKNRLISRALGSFVKRLITTRLSFISTEGYSSQSVQEFDESFDSLWQDIDKGDLILRDRSSAALSWRYTRLPNSRFFIDKIYEDKNLIGSLIYLINNSECIIYELIALDSSYIKPIMRFFIYNIRNLPAIDIIRTTLNGNNPYSNSLKGLGFLTRKVDNIFQTHLDSNLTISNSSRWLVTPGDKDV